MSGWDTLVDLAELAAQAAAQHAGASPVVTRLVGTLVDLVGHAALRAEIDRYELAEAAATTALEAKFGGET